MRFDSQYARLSELGLCDRFGQECCARSVLNSLPTAFIVIDRCGQIRLANERAGALLGRSVTDLLGQQVDGVLAPRGELLSGKPAGEEELYRELAVTLGDGRTLTIGFGVARVQGLSRDDADEQYAITFQDITPVIRLRDERNRLLSLAAINAAVPTLVHELRNPFAAITAAVEVLLEELDQEEHEPRQSLHSILRHLRRMRLVLDGFSLGRLGLHTGTNIAIDYQLEQTLLMLDRMAQNAGIVSRWRVEQMPLLPLDPTVVRAMLFNLFINSIEACQEGGEIDVVCAYEWNEQVFCMELRDTGVGMEEEDLRKCTELFYTTKVKGTGIGLALCRNAVDTAGGRLDITSSPNQGTTVTIQVPVNP